MQHKHAQQAISPLIKYCTHPFYVKEIPTGQHLKFTKVSAVNYATKTPVHHCRIQATVGWLPK